MKDVRNRTETYPLTHPQKRIWYMEKINPGQPMHNIGGTVRIQGETDLHLLEEAIRLFVRANEGIRLRLAESEREVRQYIGEDEDFPVEMFDFGDFPDGEERFADWVRREAAAPMPLCDNRLYRFALFKLPGGDSGYFAKVHHIAADGWSMNLLTGQIFDAYSQLSRGDVPEIRDGHSYLDYIDQERSYLASARFMKNKSFWNDKFALLPEPAGKSGMESGEGRRRTFRIESGLAGRIKRFAEERSVSPYTFFVAMHFIYLYITSRRDDIVIGLPLFNRAGRKEKNTVGMFTSTMPFRFRIDSNLAVDQLILELGQELTLCYYHQRYPFDLLVRDLELNKKGYGSLFDTSVNYYNTRMMDELAGAPVLNEEFYSGNQLYSYQLIIREWSGSGELRLDMDYKVRDYTEERIERIYRGLLHLAEQMIRQPGRPVKELGLLPEADWNRRIRDFNQSAADYPREKTIHRLFAEQAAGTPDRIAIRMGEETLSYRTLNERANRLAHVLIGKGVRRGTVVGLLARHSIESVVGILAVLKAGGAYLPLDPGLPADRIRYMLQDAEAGLILTNVPEGERPDGTPLPGGIVSLTAESGYSGDPSDPGERSGPSDLAYIIYTSGSTGAPKGAMIEQRGLVNYICWARRAYTEAEAADVFPLYSPLSFDLTVTSIFTPLIGGGQIAVYPEGASEFVLHRILRDGIATVVKLTPAHLSLLLDADCGCGSVRAFIVGGEDLKANLAAAVAERFGGRIRIFNEYGPTETVVGCMIHRFDPAKDTGGSVPIGVPAANTSIYVLDPDMNPVPDGETGELYISGDGVARGYLNRPELTEERFMADPFNAGARMYRTGDLARFTEGDVVEYAGRADRQLKIRGYRIEPGEIESVLLGRAGIREAVVTDRVSRSGGRYLCAYYTGVAGLTEAELSQYVRDRVPDYMIPARFVALSAIPLTINGKIDKAALPDPEAAELDPAERETVSTAAERALIPIVEELLNAAGISPSDNFYHLGGDSIKAIQIASRLAGEGYRIKVKDMLAYPRLADMALYMESSGEADGGYEAPSEGPVGTIPAASWLLAQRLPDMKHYTQSVLLSMRGEPAFTVLEAAFDAVVRRHDAFRINVGAGGGELYYNEAPFFVPNRIRVADLSDLSAAEGRKRMAAIGEKLKASFDPAGGIMIKACLFRLGDGETRLLLAAHHLAVDGISWRIIFEDISQAYERLTQDRASAESAAGTEGSDGSRDAGLSGGKSFHRFHASIGSDKSSEYVEAERLRSLAQETLPAKTASMQAWAAGLERFGRARAIRSKAYWEDVLDGATPSSWNDYDRGPDAMNQCETVELVLTEDETQRLAAKADDAYRTRADELMLIALALTVREFAGSGDVHLELERHGREEIIEGLDVSRTVGWFTSLFPVRLAVPEAGLSAQIKGLKDQLRRIPNNGLCYGVLRHVTGELDGDSGKRVRFNYLGDFEASFTGGMFGYAEEYTGRESGGCNELPCLLDIVAFTIGGRLRLSVTYSLSKFRRETAGRFARDYRDRLGAVIEHCCGRDRSEFTAADFETTSLSDDELDQLFDD
ncbi:non-ribosomal peptide synthetase [Paenibacillus nasutitermitis]|uniref:Carrier domain-containing protein n=1 Tax=Paenibacillus nasutitermitis TaxID=1652958 RepID=A0A916ZHU2_9BACL|nr:non-ribosomal peptide synthetase [Paenibacillus nasutitermitis]GGD98641.1 hypothetical protein GCM10010911_66810 [Paenibacillus nasutitermitis]